MGFVEWSDDFSVNVIEIDYQHKKLVDMINVLHDAFLSNKGNAVHKEIIDGMVDYAKVHFETEEKYMVKYNFLGYKEHHAEHISFAEKAVALQNQFNTAGFVLSLTILDFLKDWLKNHILGTDKKYSVCFNNNGLF